MVGRLTAADHARKLLPYDVPPAAVRGHSGHGRLRLENHRPRCDGHVLRWTVVRLEDGNFYRWRMRRLDPGHVRVQSERGTNGTFVAWNQARLRGRTFGR